MIENLITLVLCLRLHEHNPWVIERLKLQIAFYNPKPNILIIDFGSEKPYSDEIKKICRDKGIDYRYIDDRGIYSAAVARNSSVDFVNTDYIFFCDIDCIGNRNIFSTLNNIILSESNARFNTSILPVYHLSEFKTTELTNICPDSALLDIHLRKLFINSLRSRFDADNSYVAPYSNIFLIRKSLFIKIGGYDNKFRGHGSEDFEFLLRLALEIKTVPAPLFPDQDVLGPLTPEFFNPSPYQGFRRLFEAMAIPAELHGLRVAHLWHPRGVNTAWQERNDGRREKFRQVISEYADRIAEYRNENLCDFSDHSYLAYKAHIYSQRDFYRLDMGGRDWQSYEERAFFEMRDGNFAYAGRLFDRSFDENSERVTPLIKAAECYIAAGHLESASCRLRSAQNLRPKSKKVSKLLSTLRMKDFLNQIRRSLSG